MFDLRGNEMKNIPHVARVKNSYRIISVDIPLCRVSKELGLFTAQISIRITVYRFSSNAVKLLELYTLA
jgi:hypothetical protein